MSTCFCGGEVPNENYLYYRNTWSIVTLLHYGAEPKVEPKLDSELE